jgi:hypothetical protein
MEKSIDKKEQQRQMSNPTDRLPHHVSFHDDQRQQQRPNNANPDDQSSTSRKGLCRKKNRLITYEFSMTTVTKTLTTHYSIACACLI